MQLNNLKRVYILSKQENRDYCVFSFQKNKIEFDVFFDFNTTPYKLGFLPKNADIEIWLDVHSGFVIDSLISKEEYYSLTRILGLKYDPNNPFSTTAFFEEFNSKIPQELPSLDLYEATIVHVTINKYSIEKPDRIYYIGQKEWDKPQNRGKGNRRPENLEKTRLLYPEIYKRTKDRNISIIYSAKMSDNYKRLKETWD